MAFSREPHNNLIGLSFFNLAPLTDPQLEVVEGVLVDLLKLVVHLGGKVDQVAEVAVLVVVVGRRADA